MKKKTMMKLKNIKDTTKTIKSKLQLNNLKYTVTSFIFGEYSVHEVSKCKK